MLAQSAVEGSDHSDLCDGLSARPLSIPSKSFYDDRGSAFALALARADGTRRPVAAW